MILKDGCPRGHPFFFHNPSKFFNFEGYDLRNRTQANPVPHKEGGRAGDRLHGARRGGLVRGQGRGDARRSPRENRGLPQRQHPEERHGSGHPRHRNDRPADSHSPRSPCRTLRLRTRGAQGRDSRRGGTRKEIHRRRQNPHLPEKGLPRETLYRNPRLRKRPCQLCHNLRQPHAFRPGGQGRRAAARRRMQLRRQGLQRRGFARAESRQSMGIRHRDPARRTQLHARGRQAQQGCGGALVPRRLRPQPGQDTQEQPRTPDHGRQHLHPHTLLHLSRLRRQDGRGDDTGDE